jgi:hypothetical protein
MKFLKHFGGWLGVCAGQSRCGSGWWHTKRVLFGCDVRGQGQDSVGRDLGFGVITDEAFFQLVLAPG